MPPDPEPEEATPPVTVTGSVTAVTDYRFRGIGLSGGDIAVQGGPHPDHQKPGFMPARGLSSMEDSPVYGEVEMDLFAGWAGNIAEGIGADSA